MSEETAGYDTVRVHFYDGTSTIIYVSPEDSIEDEIVRMCEAEGFDLDGVSRYTLEA